MIRYAGNPTGYEREIAELFRSISVDDVVPALKSPYSDDHWDPLIIMEPSPTSRADWVKTTTHARRTLDIFMVQEFPFSVFNTAPLFPREGVLFP